MFRVVAFGKIIPSIPKYNFRSFSSTSKPVLTLSRKIAEGNKQLLNGKYELALKEFEISANPSDSVLNNMGACYVNLKKFDSAKEMFLRGYSLNPKNVEINYNLGCISYRANEYEQSLQYWKSVLELDPGHLSARQNYSLVLFKLIKKDIQAKKYDSAHEKLDEIMNFDGYLEYALMEKGRVYLAQNEFDNAKKCLLRVLDINPELTKAKELYLQTVFAKARWKKSIVTIEEESPAASHSLTRNSFNKL